MVYVVEAEPVAEEGAEELATEQDTTNLEPAQGKSRCIPPYLQLYNTCIVLYLYITLGCKS
uniref:Uncharacterized protein n=1 Tax=Arundo donax TaxID=35708 RepID=A0A0A9CBV8_ARUDO